MSDGPIVFLGPTLPAPEARARLPGARLAPPIRAGDVLALQRLPGPPPVLAIVDGVFERVASVWHKELLLALARGAPVWGAASMGALRAAELHRYGMVGVGRVFEGYRRGAARDDADVAVLHVPAERGAGALTTPLVDVEATLDAAAARGAVPEAERARLLERARAIAYRERRAEGVLPAPLLAAQVPQKRLDALELLERLARERPTAGPPRPELHVPTIFLRRLAARVACRPIAFGAAWLPEEERLARLSRLLGPRYVLVRLLALARALGDALGVAPAPAPAASERHLARLFGLYAAPDTPQVASARRVLGALARAWQALEERLAEGAVRIAPPDDALLAFAAALQTERFGLASRDDRDAWLTANGLGDAREHAAFVRYAFAFEHGLDPRALGIWGGAAIELARPWLAGALAETGVLDELAARAARWPAFAGEIRAWWSALPPPIRERRARACDLEGWAEIARITELPDPAAA